MTTAQKVPHGTRAWFEMLGEEMCHAAEEAELPSDMNVTAVEHFTDGDDMGDGLRAGFRLDIVAGKPKWRVGALPGERADITMHVTRAASRELNTLHGDDPRYGPAARKYMENGDFRVEGDPSRLGAWLSSVHDAVVDRTL